MMKWFKFFSGSKKGQPVIMPSGEFFFSLLILLLVLILPPLIYLVSFAITIYLLNKLYKSLKSNNYTGIWKKFAAALTSILILIGLLCLLIFPNITNSLALENHDYCNIHYLFPLRNIFYEHDVIEECLTKSAVYQKNAMVCWKMRISTIYYEEYNKPYDRCVRAVINVTEDPGDCDNLPDKMQLDCIRDIFHGLPPSNRSCVGVPESIMYGSEFNRTTLKENCERIIKEMANETVSDNKSKMSEENGQIDQVIPLKSKPLVGTNHSATTNLSNSKFFIDFDEPIAICSKEKCDFDKNGYSTDATDSMRNFIQIPNGDYVITKMRKNSTEQALFVSKEIDYQHMGTCTNITIGKENWKMDDLMLINKTRYIILTNNDKRSILISTGSSVKVDNETLHAWQIVMGYVFCDKEAHVSVLSDPIEISDPIHKVSLEWIDEGTNNPKLKSIIIPKSSLIYDEFTK
jgi:hypothetical protein